MIYVLMVGCDKGFFTEIKTVFTENEIGTQWCDSGVVALSMLPEKRIDFVIIDENLPDMDGKVFIEKVITENPMINCVIASSLSHKKFHERYEGFGVMMQLSVTPGSMEIQKLVEKMRQIICLQTIE
ncbi:MAG: response regulator [Desulfobacteraceae bacterium]|nr:response regulator [Desulfobacteraceae bacterium]